MVDLNIKKKNEKKSQKKQWSFKTLEHIDSEGKEIVSVWKQEKEIRTVIIHN